MRKAFDTFDHSILLEKLRKDLEEGFICWIKDYLPDRKQQAYVNDMVSAYATVKRGVPQGSVFGPLFFVAYVNDICGPVIHGMCYLYVDGLAVLGCGRNVDTTKQLIQEDPTSQKEQASCKYGQIKVVWSFSPRSVPDLTTAMSSMNSDQFSVIPEFNYLEAFLDSHLSMLSQLEKGDQLSASTYGYHNFKTNSRYTIGQRVM